jgi:hypothetical protein
MLESPPTRDDVLRTISFYYKSVFMQTTFVIRVKDIAFLVTKNADMMPAPCKLNSGGLKARPTLKISAL